MARVTLILEDAEPKPTLRVHSDVTETTPAVLVAALAVEAVRHLIERKVEHPEEAPV